MNDYKHKYFKYNDKYNNLLQQMGGTDIIPCDEFEGMGNRIGSCWNLVIQMILYFGDKTRKEVQHNLTNVTSSDILTRSIHLLVSILPSHLIHFVSMHDGKYGYELLPNTEQLIIKIVDILKKRFNNKKEEYEDKISSPVITRQVSIQCEKDFTESYFENYRHIDSNNI